MRPNPFALGALCLVLVGAILLVTRVAPATLGTGTVVVVARPLAPPTNVPIASAPHPATLPAHPWRDARARLARLIGLAARADANARPAVTGTATRRARWTAGRAAAARQSVTAALGATRTRASGVAGALARLDARLQAGQRRASAALHASLRRAGIGMQDHARTLFKKMEVFHLSWKGISPSPASGRGALDRRPRAGGQLAMGRGVRAVSWSR